MFSDTLGLPTVWIPHSYAACSQHAPNEHLLAPVARDALRIMTGLLGPGIGPPEAALPPTLKAERDAAARQLARAEEPAGREWLVAMLQAAKQAPDHAKWACASRNWPTRKFAGRA